MDIDAAFKVTLGAFVFWLALFLAFQVYWWVGQKSKCKNLEISSHPHPIFASLLNGTFLIVSAAHKSFHDKKLTWAIYLLRFVFFIALASFFCTALGVLERFGK